jgi:biotin--protein ligase
MVQLQTDDEGIVQVVIKGLRPSGFLEASSIDQQKTYELYPDGNSFDMFNGLIKKKN